MKFLQGWNPMRWRRGRAAVLIEDSCVETSAASGLEAPGLENLQTRLNQWSCLWGADGEQSAGNEAQRLVAQRLSHWLERCFGRHVSNTLPSGSEQISLASATPMFTAFLGRRATRELSRHVLQDV